MRRLALRALLTLADVLYAVVGVGLLVAAITFCIVLPLVIVGVAVAHGDWSTAVNFP